MPGRDPRPEQHEQHHEQRRREPLERIADLLEELLRSEVARRLQRIEAKLNQVLHLEVEQMAFAQDVLAKITAQTTLIGSIKTWIQNLPTDVVSAEDKAAILANLDANSNELSTAIPANTPSDPSQP